MASAFFGGASGTAVYETRSVDFYLYGPTWPKHPPTSQLRFHGCGVEVEWNAGSLAVATCTFSVDHDSQKALLPLESSVKVSIERIPLIDFTPISSGWIDIEEDARTLIFQATAHASVIGKPTSSSPVKGTFMFRFLVPGENESQPVQHTGSLQSQLGTTSYPYPVSQMLNFHITDGDAPDVQFTVFSKRRWDGGACGPKRLFGKQMLLSGKSDIFDLLIQNDFLAHETCPLAVEDHVYGYDSDSDLEEEDPTLPTEGGSPAESSDALQTNILTAGESPTVPSSSDIGKSGSPEATASSGGSLLFEKGNFNKHVPPNIVCSITIRDGAYATWRALIFYLYTGHTVFAPLASSGMDARKKFNHVHVQTQPRWPLPCSPKSMFRLANKYAFGELEDLALEEIIACLTPKNIVEEYFSPFTLMYERVQKAEFDYLKERMQNPDVKSSWERHVPGMLTSSEMTDFYYTTSTKLLFVS